MMRSSFQSELARNRQDEMRGRDMGKREREGESEEENGKGFGILHIELSIGRINRSKESERKQQPSNATSAATALPYTIVKTHT